MRQPHDDPPFPDDLRPKDLNNGARFELKTLNAENAEIVAKHLAMAARLIETDPELAHQHAISAARRAGRIAIVHETLAITAYTTGDYALALRELRTYRRISGSDNQLALMIDCERGLNRPEKALELGSTVARDTLPVEVQVEVAIALSGARLDLGQPEIALEELEIPQLDPSRAYQYSPGLFAAYAVVLEELGRTSEARTWHTRAVVAEEALLETFGNGETIEIEDLYDPELAQLVDREERAAQQLADEQRDERDENEQREQRNERATEPRSQGDAEFGDADADSGSGLDASTDEDVDADSGADSGAGSGSGSEKGPDEDVDADSGSGSETDSVEDSDTDVTEGQCEGQCEGGTEGQGEGQGQQPKHVRGQ